MNFQEPIVIDGDSLFDFSNLPLGTSSLESSVVACSCSVPAFDKSIADYSVTEVCVLAILCLVIIKMVLGLFSRKWGFFGW